MSALYRLEMKPNFKYVQTVSRAFHLTSATLVSGQYAKLYLTVNSKKMEVASLTRTVRQKSVDLSFSEGDKLIFHVVGKGDITLLGYALPRVPSDSEDDDDTDYDEDDEFKKDEASDASDENSDDENELMDAPPRKKFRLSLDPCPELASNVDADMEVDPEDADGPDGPDVKMSTEED